MKRLKRLRTLVMLIALLAIAVSTWAATITVPDDYPTIQAAIDAAQPGDTVYVKAGRYTENVAITKPLHLVGEDRTTTIIRSPNSEKDVIIVKLPQGNVYITDLKASGGDTGIYIHVGTGAQVTLNDVIVSENQCGVATFGDGSLTITGSYFVDNSSAGIQLGTAIAVVKSTEILRGGLGVILVGAVDATLDDNLIALCKWGIYTYIQNCGWEKAEEFFSGAVVGTGNRVYALNTDLCPGYPGASWPEGYIDQAWHDAIENAIDVYNRSKALNDRQDFQRAINSFSEGIAGLKSIQFALLEAYFHQDIGVAYWSLGRHEEALAAYQSARAVYADRRMDGAVAEVDNSIGIVYSSLGRHEEALAAYQSARAVYADRRMDGAVAGVDNNIGIVYSKLGRYEEALAAYQSARAVYDDRGMDINVAKIDQNIGVVYDDLGRYAAALATYQSARVVYVAHGMEVDVALVDENTGSVYTKLGRYEEALAAYQSARAVLFAHEMEVDVAEIDHNIGVAYDYLGRYEVALVAYQSARAVLFAHGMEVDVALVDENIGAVLIHFGLLFGAKAKYEAAREIYVGQKMLVNVANADHGIGILYSRLGQYEEAQAKYEEARAVYLKQGMDTKVSEVDQSIGIVYDDLGQHEDALEAYRLALDLLDETPPLPGMKYSYPATRWVILKNKGICYEAMEQWDQAREAYEDSIAVIESLRGYLKSEELKTAWQEQTRDVYERLIKLLIDQGQGVSAFPYAERCRARTFLDALYQGSIAPNQLISPEAGISSGAVDPKAIDQAVADARDSLQGNEAVLEYMVTDHGVYLWVITKEGIGDPSFIKYEREQLMNDVITLRKSLESDPPDQITMTELLTSFYDKLVKESLAKLPDGVDTLILIPSGPLWYLPFSALVMTDQELPTEPGTTRHPYLVERYTLAYLPSLASLSSLTKGETEAARGVRLLALADPELSPDQLREGEGSKCGEEKPLGRYEQLVTACQDFADLLVGEEQEKQCVYAGREAQEVRAHMDMGRQVVVYAAHGQFNPYVPLQSKLLLAPGGEATNLQTDSRVLDGNYHAWETLLTDHRGTELVILAACETLLPHLSDLQGTMAVLSNEECDQVVLTPQQLERIVVGDEVVGLARAFLSSGAEAVLGTLWLANPYAIGELLTSMAEYHKEGYTWMQALTKAQRELIKSNTFKNPWFWAPYQLIGRWR